MRQKFHEAAPAPRLQAPAVVGATASATTAHATRTQTPVKQKRERKARTQRKLSVRQALLGLIAFFIVPWMPATHLVQELEADNTTFSGTAGPANIAYDQAVHLYVKIARPEPPGKTTLNKRLLFASGFETAEKLQARWQVERPVRELIQKGRVLSFNTNSPVGNSYDLERFLTGVLLRDGIVKELAGDYSAAVQAYLSTLAFEEQTGQRSEFTLSTSLGLLEPSIAHLIPEQARVAREQLESFLKQRPDFIAEQLKEGNQTATYVELQAYPAGQNTFPSVEFVSRIPVVRVFINYQVGRFQSILNQRIGWMRNPTAENVARLKTRVPAWEPGELQFRYQGDLFVRHTKNTEQAQRLVQQLREIEKGK